MTENRRRDGERERTAAPRRGAAPPSPTRFAGLGIQLAVSIVLFLYLGMWLDRRLGTAPLLLIVGVFVGAGAGFWAMYKAVTADRQDHEDGPA